MREFIYYSSKGRTSGNFTDLMKAGRLDIACHVVISSFFLSHKIREDIKIAKDVAAAAMLIYAIGATVIALMIFLPKI